MLVLSRKRNESIVIGDDVIITVVRVEDGKVRLGVSAPRSTSIHRDEVYREINGLADDAPIVTVES